MDQGKNIPGISGNVFYCTECYNRSKSAGDFFMLTLNIPGLGTIVNACAIVIGGLTGLIFGSKISRKIQETLNVSMAIAVMFLGIGGTLSHMLVVKEGTIATQGEMMVIFSLAIGGVIGEIIDIDARMEQFGNWLKVRSGNAKDTRFVADFVNASLTVCIGAMAIVGSIEDGIHANHSILFAKAVLDMVIIMVMTASAGKGCIFSAVPVGLLQGSVTILSFLIAGLITDQAMANLSYVGNILIFCVGLNLLFGKKVRVANLLPALVIACFFH